MPRRISRRAVRHCLARPGVARCTRTGGGSAHPRSRAARPLGGTDGIGRRVAGRRRPYRRARKIISSKAKSMRTGYYELCATPSSARVMEDALFVEKERAQVTLNCIGDAVICTDISGNITFLNLVAEKNDGLVVARSDRPARGRSFTNSGRYQSRNHPRIRWKWQWDETESYICPPNCILVRRDGIETPIEDSVAPIHDREGQATGAVIVFRDVSAARAMASCRWSIPRSTTF